MFYTNVGTPLKLSVGDTYHDAAIALGDAIVGAASSPWAEVTGSTPTPTWLQPYASTVTALGDPTTSNGIDYSYTMYLTTDPGLGAGTPYCVIVRFTVARHGLGFLFIDTAVGDPSADSDWTWIYQTVDFNSDTSSSYGVDDVGGKLMSWSDSSTVSAVSDINRIEINIWIWDEVFAVACKDNDNATTGGMGGGVIVWSPVTTGVLGATRAQAPHVWAMNMCHLTTYSSNQSYGAARVLVPRWQTYGVEQGAGPPYLQWNPSRTDNILWSPETGLKSFYSDTVDINGNNVIARMQFINGGFEGSFSVNDMNPVFHSGPWDEGPRLVRPGLASAYLATLTIDGDNYYELKDLPTTSLDRFPECMMIIPNVDLTV